MGSVYLSTCLLVCLSACLLVYDLAAGLELGMRAVLCWAGLDWIGFGWVRLKGAEL